MEALCDATANKMCCPQTLHTTLVGPHAEPDSLPAQVPLQGDCHCLLTQRRKQQNGCITPCNRPAP